MKIIHQGVRPSERMLRVTCRSCATRFEFTTGEADRHHSGDYRDGEFWQIKCPTCEQIVSAYPNDIV